MKNFLSYSLLFISAFSLFSCAKHYYDEPGPNFHFYYWNAKSIPLTVPSSTLEQTFQLKDRDDYPAGIAGILEITAMELDSVAVVYNTVPQPELGENALSAIVSDTVRGRWFTVITEENKQLRVILDENRVWDENDPPNEKQKMRTLSIAVRVTGNPQFAGEGQSTCERLVLYQLPAKKE